MIITSHMYMSTVCFFNKVCSASPFYSFLHASSCFSRNARVNASLSLREAELLYLVSLLLGEDDGIVCLASLPIMQSAMTRS